VFEASTASRETAKSENKDKSALRKKLKNNRHDHACIGTFPVGLIWGRIRGDDGITSRVCIRSRTARHDAVWRRQRAAGRARTRHSRNRNVAGVNHFNRNTHGRRLGRGMRGLSSAQSCISNKKNKREARDMSHDKIRF
jgi:hypothetical protein